MDKLKNNRLKLPILIFIILLGIDQITKIIAICTNLNVRIWDNILNLKLVFNNGIAFGLGQGTSMTTFIVSNLIVLGIIVRFIWLQKDQMDRPTTYALFMVLAGGIGNVMDRVFRGNVVDFIEIFPKIHFPIFNIADIYIVVGWIMLAFLFARYSYKELQERKKRKGE